MESAELRARLSQRAALEPTTYPREGINLGGREPVPAAVLIGFVQGDEPGVLLTKRTATLSSHAGQVSFPGGRVDAGDADAEAAALREAHEEIGLDPALVEVVGRLGDLTTGTGFRITPVLGLLPEGMGIEALGLVPSPHEVEAIFTLPLAVLIAADGPALQRVFSRGNWRDSWVWPHERHFIFGATAEILMHLATRLRGGAA